MKYILVTIVFVFFSFSLLAQDALVQSSIKPEAEFHTAINPLDSNNIILSTQFDFADETNITIYYTTDFGNSWSVSSYQGLPTGYLKGGDAVLSFDATGNAYLVNLAVPNSGLVNTILSKSTDGGANWALVSTVETGFTDKPWLAIDTHSTSPYQGNIYIPFVDNTLNLYTLNSAYQTTNSLLIPDGLHLPSVVVKKDGTVFTSNIDIGDPNVIYVQEYTNGGTTLGHSTQVASFPDYTFNVPDVSLRFQPTAYLAIDNSGGAYDGRLYLSFTASEAVNPDYFNVFLIYSDDNGVTWSAPSTVHSDQQNDVQQFYSSMYVNNNGALILDWYDRKNYTNTNKLTDFFLGVSFDGGVNFNEIKLNSAPTDFEFVVPSSNNFGIGEYHQLVATNNTAISFWSDGRKNDGDLNIYMSKVNINGQLSVEELSVISNKIEISKLYPIPTADVIYSDIELKERMTLKYEILNSSGQVLESSDWEKYKAGSHQLQFDLDLSAGVYYVTILSDKGFYKTMKFVKY